MSRSIRCSDQAYQRVTAVAGEKGLSLIEALDDIIIIKKQAELGNGSPPETAPPKTAGPFIEFEGIKTREELKEIMREALQEASPQKPGEQPPATGSGDPRFFEVVP